MRIDDENKVVWCNKEEMEWYKTYNIWQNDKRKIIVHHLARMGFGYALTNRNGSEAENFWYKLDSIKLELIKAVIDNYTFKLEQPKKYYWRLKLEHVIEPLYIITDIYGGSYAVESVEDIEQARQLSEQEARELLKDDFYKFEKVECE